MIQVYITNARRAYALADDYRAQGRLRRARRPARHVAAGRSRGARRRDLPRPRRADVSAVPRRLPRRPAAAALRVDVGPDAGARAADPARSDPPPLATSSRTRSSSRAAVRSTATSATRTRSSRAADRSTPSASTMRSPRSSGCPAAISTSSTITCSAIARFAAALFDGMRGMGRLFQGAATVDSDPARRPRRARGRGGPAQPLRRLRDAGARQPRAAATSARTWAATTPPSRSGCTTSAS